MSVLSTSHHYPEREFFFHSWASAMCRVITVVNNTDTVQVAPECSLHENNACLSILLIIAPGTQYSARTQSIDLLVRAYKEESVLLYPPPSQHTHEFFGGRNWARISGS